MAKVISRSVLQRGREGERERERVNRKEETSRERRSTAKFTTISDPGIGHFYK